MYCQIYCGEVISGTIGPTEVVHLLKSAEFYKKMDRNIAYYVALWGKITNSQKLIFTAVKLSWFTVLEIPTKETSGGCHIPSHIIL